MTRFRTLDHAVVPMIMWDAQRPAEWVNDHIVMVHATSNVYAVIDPAGDVVINSGAAHQGARIREKIEELIGRPLKIEKLIFTQGHVDHIGGWRAFYDEGTEMCAQRMFPRLVAERRALEGFFWKRNARVIAAMLPPGQTAASLDAGDPTPLVTFHKECEFRVGGRLFRLRSIWSGETLDSLAVWLPEEKTVFTGNWAGAIHRALPNFYTARGDRQRSVPGWLRHCRDILAEEPELLITGHEQPIRGKEQIRADLTKVRDAVSHLHDATVKAMEAGTDLPTMMRTITLPANLTPREGRCPVHWIVRAVYEEYAGWFHQERTSELYATPQSELWSEIVEAMGGGEEVARRAARHLSAGDPEKALHLIEMAAFAEPTNKTVRETEIAIYDELADRTEGKIFDLLGWLEGRIMAAKAALGEQRA